jgi:hypothetical protein
VEYKTPQLKRLGSLADLTLGKTGSVPDNKGLAKKNGDRD